MDLKNGQDANSAMMVLRATDSVPVSMTSLGSDLDRQIKHRSQSVGAKGGDEDELTTRVDEAEVVIDMTDNELELVEQLFRVEWKSKTASGLPHSSRRCALLSIKRVDLCAIGMWTNESFLSFYFFFRPFCPPPPPPSSYSRRRAHALISNFSSSISVLIIVFSHHAGYGRHVPTSAHKDRSFEVRIALSMSQSGTANNVTSFTSAAVLLLIDII